jgi:hypothetical protein
LDNDDSVLETLIAKHRKQGTSILQQTESDHESKSTSKERQTRSRTDERHEHGGRKRRSQSLVKKFNNFRVLVVLHQLVFGMNIHLEILIIIIIHFWLDLHLHQVFIGLSIFLDHHHRLRN